MVRTWSDTVLLAARKKRAAFTVLIKDYINARFPHLCLVKRAQVAPVSGFRPVAEFCAKPDVMSHRLGFVGATLNRGISTEAFLNSGP